MEWLIAQTPIAPVAPDSSIIGILSQLGQTAACLLMAWFFIAFVKQILTEHAALQERLREAQEKRDDRIFQQYNRQAEAASIAVKDNTAAMGKIESTVERLTDVIENLDKK